MCDRGASYVVKQMRYSSCIRLFSAYYDEREDTMDERRSTH